MDVTLRSKFTFADSQGFRKILDSLQKSPLGSVIIDMRETEFVDSAGLGMFLLAKDIADKLNIKITIRGAQGQPGKMLKISRFDEMFTMI
jgi:anti-anti-sigma factor